MNAPKTVSIFGSTGSVGTSTLDVIEKHQLHYDVKILTAHNNYKLLIEQVRKFNPEYVVISNEQHYQSLCDELQGTDIKILSGDAALLEVASIPVDWTMSAIVGMAGLAPLMCSLKHGKIVAIANKEPLVSAGHLVMDEAKKNGTTILPVDSEHNAIFQVFEPENKQAVSRIVLTASGGPFRQLSLDELKSVTKEQALAHPNWTMGHKISIDSATMMNKALEIIEAHILFGVDIDKIEALIHPQSVIHSMVEYADGSVLAQMGASDMRTPITNALGYPNRIATSGERLDLKVLADLTFESVDTQRFPFVSMAYDAVRAGAGHCIAMNASNELAVEAFLQDKISFVDIHGIVTKIMEKDHIQSLESLNDIVDYDNVIRKQTESLITSN